MCDCATRQARDDGDTGDVFACGHLGELTRIISADLVDAALASTRGEQRRVRRLPSRVVVYLLLADALLASMGWRQVWARLTAGLPGTRSAAPTGSSITEAMRRVGPAPVKAVFDMVKGPGLVHPSQAVRFAGRLVTAIDGTQIPVPDTPANLAVFPKPRHGPNGPPGYPMVRLVALVACGTRTIIDAVFGTDQTSELAYADTLVDSGAMGPGMLLLGDRNFFASRFLVAVAVRGADFLIRAKTGPRALKLPVIKGLPDGSFLSRVDDLTVRVIEAAITSTTAAGSTRQGVYRLVTTMIDPEQAPGIALVKLYHERWEIETSYAELKSTILAGRVLRGRHPGAVVQETWAVLTAYQALRTAMADACLARPDIDPDRACFTIALNTARDQISAPIPRLNCDTATDLVGRIGAGVLAGLLPKRRQRTRPRVKKRAISSKYRAIGRDTDYRTHKTTIQIVINPLTTIPDG